MMLGIAVGTIAGAGIYAGTALLSWHLRIPPRAEWALSPLIGLMTGAITGGTGVFVIPSVPYIQALGLARDDLIQALGLSFTVSTLALAIGPAARGAFQLGSLGTSMLVVVPALLGMWVGQGLRQRIGEANFRRWFLIFLLLLGFELLLRPFF